MIKLYYPEADSEALQEWVRIENQQILYTSFHELEMKNALAIKVFRSELTQEVYRQLIQTLNRDLQKAVLRRVHPNWGRVFRRSIEISEGNTPHVGSRSLDIIHLGIALALGCERFITFDDRQADLAQRIDLEIVSIG